MGVDPYLLASTLTLVVGQRLVRNICRECNGEGGNREGGCSACRNSGYKGRSVIVEACEIDKRMKELIARKEPVSAYLEYAKSQGYLTMMNDGMEKVEWGVTSKEEVLRVLHS
jgi:type II secretory ATPase GspE/PulE/Tfp pilus assembly ATPase PilB-like protein